MSQNQNFLSTEEIKILDSPNIGNIVRKNKNLRDRVFKITNFLDDYYKKVFPSQRLWHIKNNHMGLYLCKKCKIKPTNYSHDIKGYRDYCSIKCSRNEAFYKHKKTMIERYGVENPMQCEMIKKKTFNTMIERYGVSSFLSTKKAQESHRVHTKLHNEEIIKKRNNTIIVKYGSMETYFNLRIKRMVESNLKNFGVEHPSTLQENRNRARSTTKKKYGVEYASQNPIIFDKQITNSYKTKKYQMPSGRVVNIQGFEDIALDKLLNYYNEEDLVIERNEVPEIWYTFEGIKRRYFPDIFIPNENRIIEVKSTWTFKQAIKQNLVKKEACINKGYQFDFMIL